MADNIMVLGEFAWTAGYVTSVHTSCTLQKGMNKKASKVTAFTMTSDSISLVTGPNTMSWIYSRVIVIGRDRVSH